MHRKVNVIWRLGVALSCLSWIFANATLAFPEGTADGPVAWSLRWTAPLSGSVTFYLAGNAADGNGDPGNDYVYALTHTVAEPTVSVVNRTWSGVKELYRRR